MAKARIPITQSYQTVATGVAIFTIDEVGDGAIFFDTTGDDSTAYKVTALINEQFSENAVQDTQVRASGDGWVIIVDGTL